MEPDINGDGQGPPEAVVVSLLTQNGIDHRRYVPDDARLQHCVVNKSWMRDTRLIFAGLILCVVGIGFVLIRLVQATEDVVDRLDNLPHPITAEEIDKVRKEAVREYVREQMVRKHREEQGRAGSKRDGEVGRPERGGRDGGGLDPR